MPGLPGNMMDSDDDTNPGDLETRDRSRSPIGRRGDDGSDLDLENLSPNSEKILKIVRHAIAEEIGPVKRNLNKLADTTSQIKGTVDQNKRTAMDIKKSTAQIEDRLKKSTKMDPKSSLSGFKLNKLNNSVFQLLKKGKKREQLQAEVVTELIDRGVIDPTEEDAVKAVAKTEFSHLKSHVRGLISTDLAAGNTAELPKTAHYLKKHLNMESIDDSTQEYMIIMALGLAKYENHRSVPLGEADRENKRRIEEHVDNYWSWVAMKFEKHQERGDTYDRKLKAVIENCGYEPKKNEGAVRRSSI